jgi:hypothetical protein
MKIEEPVRRLIYASADELPKLLQDNSNLLLLFVWLNLIFFKTRYKDRKLRLYRDFRKPDDRISDLYDWEELHHIHCVARSFFTQIPLASNVVGSIYVLPTQTNGLDSNFDYADLPVAQSIMLRLGEVAVVAALNDSGGAAALLGRPFADSIASVSMPLSPIQVREILARVAYANLCIEERPKYHTYLEEKSGQLGIEATHSPIVIASNFVADDYGKILHFLVNEALPDLAPMVDELDLKVRSGKFSFLIAK